MLAVNTSTSESTGHTPAFLTQGREPRLPSSLYDKEALGFGRARTSWGKCQQTERGIRDRAAKYRKGVQGPSQTLQTEKEAMVTSGGRHSVGQGTSPVQSGWRIRCKTSPEVRWPLPGRRFRLQSPVICKIGHTQSKKERTVHVGELKQQQNEQTAETSDV